MATAELVRQEWADGYRRLESEREHPLRFRMLLAQADAVACELRRRVGSVFTLDELAAEYGGSDRWALAALAELPPEARYPAGVSIATDAAFLLYARGAQDYVP